MNYHEKLTTFDFGDFFLEVAAGEVNSEVDLESIEEELKLFSPMVFSLR